MFTGDCRFKSNQLSQKEEKKTKRSLSSNEIICTNDDNIGRSFSNLPKKNKCIQYPNIG